MEHHLSSNPMLAIAACWYWIRKLQARYLAGDYTAAMDASSKAQRFALEVTVTPRNRGVLLLWRAFPRGILGFRASRSKKRHFEGLKAHHNQLKIWAQNCPEKFENRVALVGAEIARIEGRELDAERLYEQAIGSARANGFIHNEALAYELAAAVLRVAWVQADRGPVSVGARYGYLRWGAVGKVRQLDERYPDLRQGDLLPGPMSTIGAPV